MAGIHYAKLFAYRQWSCVSGRCGLRLSSPRTPFSRSWQFQIARRHRRVGRRPPGADGMGSDV